MALVRNGAKLSEVGDQLIMEPGPGIQWVLA